MFLACGVSASRLLLRFPRLTEWYGPSQLETRKRDLARGCGLAQDDIVWVSATTGIGIVKLRASVGNYSNVKNANKKR
jgi:hypothetical protein